LVERISSIGPSELWRALGRASKGLRPDERIALGDGTLLAHVRTAQGPTGMVEVELVAQAGSATDAIERLGAMPLPPYIRRAAEAQDASRYQTVYAAQPGAVAAPTAGLHFTEGLLEALRARGHELAYVTLHVGPGTFAPLRSDDLREHVMHEERFEIPAATSAAIARARRDGRQVLAVGTTVVRALESAARPSDVAPGAAATSIFIYPPYRFRVVDALLTNFHLPRSTLLALVMAFGGVERMRAAYRAAIDGGYRFYSYGDAMLELLQTPADER
jgi:S-adenosylmethionine:tRNA ribosyltransferase-isomerase